MIPDDHSINGVNKSVISSQSHSHRHNCTPLDHYNTEPETYLMWPFCILISYVHMRNMAITASANFHACLYDFGV